MTEDPGILSTAVSIWIAMGAWTLSILLRGRSSWWFRLVGLVSYLVHIVAAYASFYQWSHAVAWEKTANDTREVVGWETGIGLLFNYVLAILLIVDLALALKRGRIKDRFQKAVDLLLVFFLINGAIIFGDGSVRIYGALLFFLLVIGFLVRRSSAARGTPVVE